MQTPKASPLPSSARPPHGVRLQQACDRALRMIARRAPRREILTHLATSAEVLSGPRTVVSILVLDENGLLRNGASPNLPSDYLDAIDRLRPQADLGTCAAAAATGEIVITPDFCADAKWRSCATCRWRWGSSAHGASPSSRRKDACSARSARISAAALAIGDPRCP